MCLKKGQRDVKRSDEEADKKKAGGGVVGGRGALCVDYEGQR